MNRKDLALSKVFEFPCCDFWNSTSATSLGSAVQCQTDREMSISGQMENFEYGTPPPPRCSGYTRLSFLIWTGDQLWFPKRCQKITRYTSLQNLVAHALFYGSLKLLFSIWARQRKLFQSKQLLQRCSLLLIKGYKTG